MEGIRISISQRRLPLHAIEAWIRTNRPDHHAALFDDTPTWVPCLLKHLEAEERDGFEKVSRDQRSSRSDGPPTVLSIWKDSVDLDMFSALSQPVRIKSAAHPLTRKAPIVKSQNPFDLLDIDVAPDAVQGYEATWNYMSALRPSAFSAPASTTRSDPASIAKAASAPNLPGLTLTNGFSSPFSTASSFVAAFGPIPKVPTSHKSIETLEGESLWSMSKGERKRLFAHWHVRAWEETSETQFAQLDRIREEHEKARKANEQLRTQVSFIYVSINSPIGESRLLHELRLVRRLASTEPAVSALRLRDSRMHVVRSGQDGSPDQGQHV